MAEGKKEDNVNFANLDDTLEAYTVVEGPEGKRAIPKFNRKTQTFKFWNSRRHKMMFELIDIYRDIAKGNKIVYANIMLLLAHTDKTNLLTKQENSRHYAIQDEESIMDLLKIKKSAWYKLKPIIFNKILPVLAKCKIQTDNGIYTNYYVNPLLTADYMGISIPCYLVFRNCLKPYLCDRDYYTLEKHLKTLIGDEKLPHEQLQYKI